MADVNNELDNNEEINLNAEELLKKENEEEKQYKEDYNKLLTEIVEIATKLRKVQENIQKRTSKKAKEKLGIAYEVTDEKLNDPASLGNLDELHDMETYYNGLYNEAMEKSQSEKKWGERRYNKKIAKEYRDAYDLTSEISAKVQNFVDKYRERLDAEQIIENDQTPDLTPTEPTPTEVVPTEPTPTEVVPTEPTPTEVVPTEPTPTEVVPTEPTPTEVIPTEPTPTEVVPTEPTPTEVVPTEPTPTEVVPTEPTPTEVVPTEPTPSNGVTPRPPRPRKPAKPSILKNIDKKYFGQIFKLLNQTAVIGNKYKYNTLDYLEYQLVNADIEKMHELGFPVNDPEKSELIKKVCLKLVRESKEIRKDQWMSANDERKQGQFEARKHSTQESVVDRNLRLMKKFRISKAIAAEYGLATSVEDLQNNRKGKKAIKETITSAKDDPKFIEFFEGFKNIYKLGSPTSESNDVLYKVYEDLKKNKENNSFGLTGNSLTAAMRLVEQTIIERRNTWQNGKVSSQKSIEQTQKELGM